MPRSLPLSVSCCASALPISKRRIAGPAHFWTKLVQNSSPVRNKKYLFSVLDGFPDALFQEDKTANLDHAAPEDKLQILEVSVRAAAILPDREAELGE
jgi:hypothetical protein